MLSDKILTEILSDWSFWDNNPPKSFHRKIELPKKLHQDLVLTISGVRRCGKSTLLTQLPKYYNLDLKACYFCNFEDPRLMDCLDYNLLTEIVNIARKNITKNKPCYFFFDEIQNVQGWEKWMHAQLERPKENYFLLTGSNSYLLSGEFATALTGRYISLELLPFSFAEFKEFTGKSFNDYLANSGFPRSLSISEPKKLLQDYFNDIIMRDVLRRVQARNVASIKQVAKMVFDTCGSELSFRKIAAITGLTVDTVKIYLSACEQAYLLFTCPYFSFSARQRNYRQKKYYPIDHGLRNAVSSTHSYDNSKSLELLVFLHLKQTKEQVFYWQEPHKGEVDFVTLDGDEITPYQVSMQNIQPRHNKALDSFYAAYPQSKDAVFINKDNAEEFLGSAITSLALMPFFY